MKKCVLTLLVTIFVSAISFAQGFGGQGQRSRMDRNEMIKMRTEQMVQKYGLNEEQATALKALFEKTTPNMNGARREGNRHEGADSARVRRNRGNGDQGSRMQRGQGGSRMMGGANNEEFNAELQKIMTAEQYKSYTEDREKMMKEFGQRRGQFGGRRGDRQRNGEE